MVSHKNVPVPGDTLVPSARAERRRIFADDVSGVVVYAIAVGVLAIAIMAAVLLA